MHKNVSSSFNLCVTHEKQNYWSVEQQRDRKTIMISLHNVMIMCVHKSCLLQYAYNIIEIFPWNTGRTCKKCLFLLIRANQYTLPVSININNIAASCHKNGSNSLLLLLHEQFLQHHKLICNIINRFFGWCWNKPNMIRLWLFVWKHYCNSLMQTYARRFTIINLSRVLIIL